jgi:hypothetical protein
MNYFQFFLRTSCIYEDQPSLCIVFGEDLETFSMKMLVTDREENEVHWGFPLSCVTPVGCVCMSDLLFSFLGSANVPKRRA